MQLLSKQYSQEFLQILQQHDEKVVVQFINNVGKKQGKPFTDKLSNLLAVGWKHCNEAIAIGLNKFRAGETNSADVSLALHKVFPFGRHVRLPTGKIGRIASYANTHADGYYMYLEINGLVQSLKITVHWTLMPSNKLLALPYYPAPLTEEEKATIAEFDLWSGGY